MATSIAMPGSLSNKKVRLNPARRKAAKAKGAGQSLQSDLIGVNAGATCSPAKDPSLSSTAGDPIPSNAGVNQSAIRRRRDIQKTAAAKAKPPPKQIASAQSENGRPHRAHNYGAMKAAALSTPAFVTGGLAGCAAGAAILLGTSVWSQIAGADSAILTARTSKMVVNNLVEELIASLKAGSHNAPEALDMLRRTTLPYASTIPGGTAFVERLFREIDVVRRQRGGEVDRAVVETRSELANARKRGASAGEMQMTVLKQLAKLSAFTSNATQDMLARNPGLRPYFSATEKKQRVPTLKVNMIVKQKNKEANTG